MSEDLYRIAELTDVQLLELLCSTEQDEIAYAHFLDRFLPHVEKECSRVCKCRKIDPHIGKQIAHDTFERVRKYKSFKKDQIKIDDDRKAIVVYLNRVSTSLFNDYHKQEEKRSIIHKSYFDDIRCSQESYTDIDGLRKKRDISELIMKKLNPKERIILIKDLEFKRHQKYLPNDVINTLAVELNIKRDTVRKIRERAIGKIKKAIDEINGNGK